MRKPAGVLTAALTMATGTVAAQPDLGAMQQRLEQLETLVGTLRTELDAERAARQRVEASTWVRPVTDGKSLKMQSPSGDFSFQAGGRLEADAVHHNEDRQKLGDGTDIRRGRVYLQGTVLRDWDWKFEYEFADNALTSTNSRGITNAFVRYKGFAPC